MATPGPVYDHMAGSTETEGACLTPPESPMPKETVQARWLTQAAHDLRHPMSAILAYAELLLSDSETPLAAEHRDLVESIQSCTDSALLLIDDLADLAIIEAGLEPLELSPVHLQAVLEYSISVVSPLAQKKNTPITLLCSEPTVTVLAHQDRICQAFVNVIRNAIEYSPPASQVVISAEEFGAFAKVAFADNGPGIPKDEFGRLFEPFQKTRLRAASSSPSTGLGLAICKRIVERHGGQIWAETLLGRGTTFYLTLRRSPPAAR